MARKLTIAGLIAVLLVAVVFVVACGGDTTDDHDAAPANDHRATGAAGPATGEPIKIGVTGLADRQAAPAFPAVQKGYQLEVEAFNATGGLNGRPIRADQRRRQVRPRDRRVGGDEAHHPGQGRCSSRRPLSTPAALAVEPLAEQVRVPVLRWDTPTLDSPATNAKWAFIASVGPQDVADALEKQIAAQGWKKIVAAADILPPNFQPLQILEKDAASKGFTINYLKDTWQLDATDLTPQINKIYAAYQADKPDVLFVMSAIVQTPVLTKGLMDLGVTVAQPVTARSRAIRVSSPTVLKPWKACTSSARASSIPRSCPMTIRTRQVMLDFVTRYTAKYNEPASLFAGLGYDSAHILFEGLKAGVDDPAKIRDGIEAIKNSAAVAGLMAPIRDRSRPPRWLQRVAGQGWPVHLRESLN